MMDDDDGKENGRESLHAIKERPEEEGEEDDRIMRQIV